MNQGCFKSISKCWILRRGQSVHVSQRSIKVHTSWSSAVHKIL